ncbi:MAG TPA: FCD domain-containing protein [Candidatus Acidoferrum sp.]|nr:FCD domain-containing protein [Candidatus Acidoferrum sp.]
MRAFIEERIREGQWPAGHQLPTERELVEHFGIARNTVRKTLRALEERGTIERHVGRGTFVASPREADEPDLVQRIHRASPAEIMEARLLIEPDVVGLAAARASADDLAAMEECLRRAESAPSVDEFEHWDGRLHETILGAARNGLIADIYAAINSVRRQAEWRKLKERTLTPERRALYEEQHRRIVAALRDRDPEAARRTLRDHLSAVAANLLG